MNLNLKDEIKEYQFQFVWSRISKGTVFKTVDGYNVRIINPGVWNKEEGPDFKNALIEIDGKMQEGDVELHLISSAWKQHGHDKDKNYSNVILHIVRQSQKKSSTGADISNIPTVEIPYGIISEFNSKNKEKYPKGYCAELFKKLSDQKVENLFISAGIERLKEKAEKAVDDILKHGAEKAFLIRMFDALGYKKNREQFAELFKRIYEYDLIFKDKENFELNALLWGESGFLPDPTQFVCNDDSMLDFIRQTWKTWWKLRKGNRESIAWNLSGVRPQNNPCRRIAAAQILLSRFGIKNRFSDLIDIFAESGNFNIAWKDFKHYLICHDELWDSYSSFNAPLKTKFAVLGEARALDIMVNVILPLMYAYGLVNNMQSLRNSIIKVYLNLPSAQNNIIMEMSAERWLMPKERAGKVMKSAAAQQGVIYLHRKYCEILSMNCENCEIMNMET